MFPAFAGRKIPAAAKFAWRFLHQKPSPSARQHVNAMLLRIRNPFRRLVVVIKFGAACHLVGSHSFLPFPTGGPSMLPTLEVAGDFVLLDCRYRRGRNVQVGDVVGYYIPIHLEDWGVKRVLGMPGDYVVLHPDGSVPEKNNAMIQVPEGHCWLAGDNLAVSRDSRSFGPVPLALIRGKCVAKILPMRSAQWFDDGLKPVE